jgi:ADP-heptose:LPS heptosyltransferase
LPTDSKHIAVIRLSAMGDVAMTVPVLRALVSQHPNVQVTMVSRPFFASFFADIPNVSFFAVDLAKKHKGFWGLIRLYRDLKNLGIDAVADLHQVTRSKIVGMLFRLSGNKVASLDKARAQRKALTRPENKIFKPIKPVTARYADVFAALGFPVDISRPAFPERQPLPENIVRMTGGKMGKWIGIAPFAQHGSKVYPLDLMQQVVDGLAQSASRLLLFGGGLAEIEQLKELAGEHDNAVVVAGELSLTEELQLMLHLDAMLSMDSANAHLAAMLGVKTITLWGATHPFAGFAPFAQPLENAITADREKFPKLPTSVYGNKKIAGYEDAMRTIAPGTVIRKVVRVLGL